MSLQTITSSIYRRVMRSISTRFHALIGARPRAFARVVESSLDGSIKVGKRVPQKCSAGTVVYDLVENQESIGSLSISKKGDDSKAKYFLRFDDKFGITHHTIGFVTRDGRFTNFKHKPIKGNFVTYKAAAPKTNNTKVKIRNGKRFVTLGNGLSITEEQYKRLKSSGKLEDFMRHGKPPSSPPPVTSRPVGAPKEIVKPRPPKGPKPDWLLKAKEAKKNKHSSSTYVRVAPGINIKREQYNKLKKAGLIENLIRNIAIPEGKPNMRGKAKSHRIIPAPPARPKPSKLSAQTNRSKDVQIGSKHYVEAAPGIMLRREHYQKLKKYKKLDQFLGVVTPPKVPPPITINSRHESLLNHSSKTKGKGVKRASKKTSKVMPSLRKKKPRL